MFTFSCQQSEIVPIVCHRCRWYRWQFATGAIDTGDFCHRYHWNRWQIYHRYQQHHRSGGKIFRRCRWYRWCTLTCKYLRKFSQQILINWDWPVKTVLAVRSKNGSFVWSSRSRTWAGLARLTTMPTKMAAIVPTPMVFCRVNFGFVSLCSLVFT